MGTNEELRDATNELTAEVHTLSGRITAKELLHKRTRRLTLLSLAVAAIAIVALVMVYSLARSNKDTNAYWSGCLSRWGEASSERSEVVGKASEERDKKQGAKDRAMRILVDYRGDPNNAATDQAKADYRMADDEAIAAERELQFLREKYPPPQIEDFCTRMKDTVADPKDQGQ
jgi:cytochrome c-type biogenesis protein CcmE